MVLLLQWVFSAIAMLGVAEIVPGFFVLDFQSAAIAALAIGFLNAVIGAVFRMIALPQGGLLLGTCLLVINSVVIKIAPSVVPGFRVTGFLPALWGAIILSVLGMMIKGIVEDA